MTAHFNLLSTFSTSLVYLSNQPMACGQPASSHSCDSWPVRALDPGGIVLRWSANGFPGWTLAQASGRAVTVDGRAAKISTHRTVCPRSLGADHQISVVISRKTVNNWYELDGCFRDPGATTALAEVRALLDTVGISGS